MIRDSMIIWKFLVLLNQSLPSWKMIAMYIYFAGNTMFFNQMVIYTLNNTWDKIYFQFKLDIF